MSKRSGKNGAFKLGTTAVAGIDGWTGGGITTEMLDATDLEDAFDVFEPGHCMSDDITINGYFDPDDTTGQDVLVAAALAGTSLSDPRLYYSSTEYLKLTDGSSSPGDAVCKVTNVGPISTDRKAGRMIERTFTLRVSGGYFTKNA